MTSARRRHRRPRNSACSANCRREPLAPTEATHEPRRLHLRRDAHADRPLRRRARPGAHRRPRRDPDPRAAGAPSRLGGGGRRGDPRLRQPGRRGQPQRRPHGRASRRPARQRAGHDHEPALRLRPRCRRHRGPRHPCRRTRPRHRRRRRIDDPGAAGDGQGRGRLSAIRRHLRHHHRLALHQPADEGAVRRRFDAGDRRERRRGIPGEPRRPGRLRVPLAAAGEAGAGERRPDGADGSGRGAGRQGRADHRDRGRASAPRHDAGGAGQAEADRAARRHRDRRQRLRRQRRRAGADRRLGRGRRTPRTDADRARARHGDRRRAAAHHGHRAGAGDPQAAGPPRHEDCRFRFDRAQRGVRQPGAGLPTAAWDSRRCRARQPERRGDRFRPSARHVGGASGRRCRDRTGAAGSRYGLATMCVGVGQGVAMALESVR